MRQETLSGETRKAAPQPMSARRRRNRRKYYLYETVSLLLFMAVVYLLCMGLIRYVVQRSVVEGSSMYPTMEDGDSLMIDKISYRFREPERFEIIVFRYPHGQDTYYIKRIIGLPGETVRIQDGRVYINGELLEESYGTDLIRNAGRANQEITLGTDEYFVLGDNRNVSSDSRDPSVGNVSIEQIVGRVMFRVYPFDRFGAVD